MLKARRKSRAGIFGQLTRRQASTAKKRNLFLLPTLLGCLMFIVAAALSSWVLAERSKADPTVAAQPPPWLLQAEESPPNQPAQGQSKEAGPAGPTAAELRESREAFRGLDAAEAAQAAKHAFPEILNAPAYQLPELTKDEHVTGYPTPDVAQLELPGEKHAVIESKLPLVTPNASGHRAPVDLSLSEHGGAIEPVNPLVSLRLPERLAEGIKLPESGLTLTPVDGEGNPLGGSAAAIVGASAFYANTQTDTDTLAKALPAGFDTQTLLRSPASPETLRFSISAPGNPTLTEAQDGSVAIEAGGKTIATIAPVTAVDAAGTPVPVTMEVEKDELVLKVDHRSSEFQFPIEVDPTVIDANAFHASMGPFTFQTNNSSAFKGYWQQTESPPYGLVIEENGGQFNSGDAGYWSYKTQGSSHIYEFDAWIEAPQNPAIDNLIGLAGPGGWEKQSWLGPDLLGEDENTVCAVESCASTGGSEGNAASWGMAALESGHKAYGRLAQASVKIAQEGGPSVSFDTTDKEIEGHPNLLYGSGVWVKSADEARLEANATDPGIGIYKRSLLSTNDPGWSGKIADGPAAGCQGVQCKESYSIPASVGDLPEGSNTVEAKVENATGASATATAQVKVDNTPPTLTLSGSMTEQGTLGTKWPTYELEVNARDGSSKHPQSGVAKTVIKVDGKVVDEAAPGCTTENCSISRNWTLESSKYSAGHHTVEVTATDAVGNTTTKTLTIEVQHAPPPTSRASSPKLAPAFLPENTAKEIAVLPTLDPLNRTESPLSDSGKWSALAWDSSTSGHNTGRDTTEGWGPYDAYSTVNGAYWNPSTFSDKTGNAAAITMKTAPGSESRYVALWLDMNNPSTTKSGYQLRWTVNSGGSTYTVKLVKWSAGSETVLASNASVTIAASTTIAISDTGGTVTAWQGTSGSFTSLLSAEDATFTGGYAGMEGAGNLSRSTNFKAGVLLGEAIAGASVLDNLERQEVPLATGKWSKTSWATEIGGAWMGSYRGYGSNGGLAGAYWNPSTFSDAQGGDFTAATVGTGAPREGEYLAMWLDMPNPGSARSGYEARFAGVNGSQTNYKVELSKWVSGTRTVLASTSGFSLPVGTTMALTEAGGSIALWTGTSSLTPLLSASDSTYTSGYAGLEVDGGGGTEYDFKAGSISSIAEKLVGLPVTEPFSGSSESLSNFASKWSALGWAGGSTPKGSDTTSGWGPANAYSTVNGAYYNSSVTDTGPGIADVATMASNPELTERYFSLWLDMPTPSSTQAGYELRFTDTATNTYEVKLSKWASGTQTVLASKSSYSFSNGNSFALVEQGGTVSAWTNTGSGFVQLLSANDSTFSGGYAGLDGSGNNTRLTNFKLGSLGSAPPETTISAGPKGVVVPNVSFTFTSNEAGSTFECSLDSAAFSTCTSPQSYQGLSEGTHKFRVRAKDAAGTGTPAERSIEVVNTAKAVTKVHLLDNLERSEVPLATGKWSKTSWAGEIGGAWTGGFRGYGSNGGLAGAYWNPTSFSDGEGTALVSATVGTGAPAEGEYLAMWLDMPNPGSARSGYEARFTGVNGSQSNYKVELSKWVSGTRTVLASTSGFSLPVGTVVALSETAGGSLALWSGTSTMSTVLTASDSTYTSGYAGLEVNGGAGTEYDFRAGQINIQAPETTITSGPSGKVSPEDVSFEFTSSQSESTFECSLDGGAYSSCTSPKAYPGLAVGSHTFRVRATDNVGNRDETPAERSFQVVEPPHTTITSPKPSYTGGEYPPITFTSSQPESTFKCSLDNPHEEPTTACTSPYSLPEHLSPGWHTFVVAATDKEGITDPTPAKWKFNPAIYPPAPSTSKLISPEAGAKSSSYYTLQAEWGNPPKEGGVTGVTFQFKAPDMKAFSTIPAEYVKNSKGNQVSWPLAVESNPGKSEAVYFDAKAFTYNTPEFPNEHFKLTEETEFRAVFDGSPEAAGASVPITAPFDEHFSNPLDATEKIGPASVDLVTGGYTISKTNVLDPRTWIGSQSGIHPKL